MIFDKQAAHVGYNDEAHVYKHVNTGQQYMSVTTLIHKFVPEFDTYYWSTYKAVKDVLEEKNMWYDYKKKAGGWESVVPYFNANYMELGGPTYGLIQKRQQWYVFKWEVEKNDACEKGSAIHNQLEEASYHAQHVKDEENTIYRVSQNNILALQDFTTNGAYPELLIYNDFYMVAGQADKVFKEGRRVDIHDYKTCKDITTEGFRGETLLAPFDHLPNANYWIYTLQLSMYAWMLEKCGYEVGSLQMHWIRGKDKFDKERNHAVETFTLPYLKQEVQMMMELRGNY